MLIGHRFERTAQVDLLIHPRNLLLNACCVLMASVALAIPMAFAVGAIARGYSPLAHLDGVSWLLAVLCLLLVAAIAAPWHSQEPQRDHSPIEEQGHTVDER